MAYDDTPSLRNQGTTLRVGSNYITGITGLSNFGGSTASQIDISSLTSDSREFALGLGDAGELSLQGVSVPHSPGMLDLAAANRDGTQRNVTVIMGGVPSGERRSDGSPVTASPAITATFAHDDTTDIATVTVADASALSPLVVGDYLDFGSGNYGRVTAEPTIASGAATILASTMTAPTGTTFTIVRPANKFTFDCVVSEHQYDIQTDEVMRFNTVLRINGAITHEVGAPSVTV